jgi:hypothetical protein
VSLSVDTNGTFKYVLEDKRGLPEAEQPYLVFKYLSARDCSKMDRLFTKAMEATAVDEILQPACEGIAVGLVDWHGYDQPFNAADIDAILTRADIMELVRELGSAMTVNQREKKASVSRSLSTSGKSANEAATVSA